MVLLLLLLLLLPPPVLKVIVRLLFDFAYLHERFAVSCW
jgi:hypothetical protein